MVIMENSDRKNGYLEIILQKMVILQDSGNKIFISQYSGWNKCYLARLCQKNGYLAGFWQKSVISQEPGRKLAIHQDSGREMLSCKILAEWTAILQKSGDKWLSCKALKKLIILKDYGRKNAYLAIIWRKKVILQDSGRKIVILQYSGWMNGYLARVWRKKGFIARFWQKRVNSQESGRILFIEHDSDRNLSSCKILAKWRVILRDTDKNGYCWITLTARMSILQ